MKEKRAKIAVCILTFAGLLGVWTLATAGNLQPSAPPAPTMKTLDEIYDAVIAGLSGVSERQGYLEHVEVDPCDANSLFTVSEGKQFVLLKLVFRYDSATERRKARLTANDNFLTGYPYLRSYWNPSNYIQSFADFPDRCVVVNAGEVLKVVNNESVELNAMIVGYLYDVNDVE